MLSSFRLFGLVKDNCVFIAVGLHFVPSGITATEGNGRTALHQIQRDRLGPSAST